MMLLGIGALLVAAMALTINALREEHTPELVGLQAAQLCGQIRLVLQDLWSPTSHATGQPFRTSARSLSLPVRLGDETYAVLLDNSTIAVLASSANATCPSGIPAFGSGRGSGEITLSWTRSGSHDLMELR